MSKRQVIVLWAIALVLVGALVAVKSSKNEGFQSATERSRGETLLKNFNPDEVTQLTISNADGSATLAKKDGAWTVTSRDSYPANTANINDLLREVAEVTVTQGVEAEASFAPRFGMDPDAKESSGRGTLLVLTDAAGSELAKITFGKNLESASDPMSPFGGGSTGRFIRNDNDPSGVYVTSELFPTVNSDPKSWLNEDFLRIEKIQSITLSEPGKPDTIAWKLTRSDESGNFELEGKLANEILDTNALTPLKSIFSYARFEDVIPAADANELWKADAKQKAVIETFEGFTYTIALGPAKAAEAKEGEAAAPAERFLMTIKVDATIPAERKIEDADSDEQNTEKDAAFTTRKAELEKGLSDTKNLEGQTYQVSKFTIDALLKNRVGLIQSAPPAGTPQIGTPSGFPGGLPPGAARSPIQAVTPPIAIPSRPPEE